MKIKSGIIILLCFFSFFSCRSAGEKTSGYDLKVYPQLGHSDIISTIIFTPDNRYVVSGALDTTVKVWDIYTGREKETFFGHTGLIRALAVSPCGSLIASSAQDGVRVWDFKTGKEIAMFNEEAVSLFFSPDELMLYTASANGIKIWDIKKRKVVKTITAENVSMASAGSNDNIAYNSDSLIIYNTNTGSKKTFNNDFITSVFLSSDDRYLAGGSRDGAILFWDLNGTGYERISAHVRRINSVAISGNSRFLASASDDNTVVLFDLFNERRRKNLTGHTDNVNAVAFSPDSRFMATASSDKTIKIWDTAGGEEIRTISANYDVPVLSVISKDEQFIATFTNNNFLRLWNAKTGQLIDSFKINDKISSIAFSHDNDSIITVSPDGYVRFYVIKTGKSNTQNPISGYEAALAQSFSPCGSFVAAALWDGNIRIWNYLLESKLDYELNDSVLVTAISFCSENLSAIIGFSNGKVSIMDLQTKKIKVLARHKDTIAAVQFNHDGTKLVYGTESGEIHIINTKNGRRLAPVLRHQFKITSLSFSADDKKIVSGALDNTVVMWNAVTGEKIASFITFNDDEWITVTTDGYYISSLRGDDLLNVRIDNDVYGMDQFSSFFSQEDVVSARLSGAEDPAFVSITNDWMSFVPPSVQISAPSQSDSGIEEINVLIKDRFHYLDKIQIIINGRLLGEKELNNAYGDSIAAEATNIIVRDKLYEVDFSLIVNLEPGPNRIQVVAKNNYAVSEGRDFTFIYNYSDAKEVPIDLWILAVGTNNYIYGKPENNLRFPARNANGIKSVLENQRGSRYRNVHAKVIADTEATLPIKENILKNIEEFFADVSPDDVLVLYLSGHGMDDKNRQYYYLPQDVYFSPDGEPDFSGAISLEDLNSFHNLPGRKIIFIDSCYSGGIDSSRLLKSLKNQSTAIFTSSQDNQLSWEGSESVGYGIFTDALINGIRGDNVINNEISLFALGRYVYDRVVQLTSFAQDTQHPYIYIPEGLYNFVISVK